MFSIVTFWSPSFAPSKVTSPEIVIADGLPTTVNSALCSPSGSLLSDAPAIVPKEAIVPHSASSPRVNSNTPPEVSPVPLASISISKSTVPSALVTTVLTTESLAANAMLAGINVNIIINTINRDNFLFMFVFPPLKYVF